MGFVKTQPCCLHSLGDCEGVVEADHAGDRVIHRAPDETCIALCSKHHYDRTNSRGFFAEMTKPERREWRMARIVETQRAFKIEKEGFDFYE